MASNAPNAHRGLLLALSLLTLVAACAPAAVIRSATPAALEVANATPSPQQIFLDGRRIGVVGSGERRRFDALAPGEHRIVAQPPTGGVTAAEALALADGAVTLWTLRTDAAPVPVPAGLGALLVTNALGRDVGLHFDGVRLATVFAGERRAIEGLPSGSHTLEARSLADPKTVRATLDILPETVTIWQVRAPMGALRIHNSWSEPARVVVDGGDVGLAPAGGTLDVPDRYAGVSSVEATGIETRSVARGEVSVPDGGTADWHLAESGGSITVANRATESVAVAVDGSVKAVILPLEAAQVGPLAPGVHDVEIVGAQSGYRLTRALRLGSGEHATWRFDPRYGTVRVHNASSEPQLLYVDAERRDELAPGASLLLTDVPVGPHTLASIGTRSGTRRDRPIHARPEGTEVWAIESPHARLAVENKRSEAMRVFVDADLHAIVSPGQWLAVDGIVAGRRLLEAVGQDTGTVVRERARLDEGSTYTLVLEDPTAVLVIENASGEDLRTGPRLAGQAARILRGERKAFVLPAGRRRIVLVGSETGFRYGLEAELVSGAEDAWRISPPTGKLVVYNRSSEPLHVALDGVPAETVAPGKDAVLAAVAAGRHVVHVQGATSHGSVQWPVALPPDGRKSLEVRPFLATVRIQNLTAESVVVAVGGQPFARLEPAAVLQLGDLKPGPVTLSARGVRSGIRHDTRVDADATRTGVWQILPARGAVLVDSETSVALRIDDEPAGRAGGPGEPRLLQVPAGTRKLEARETDGEGYVSLPVRVAPDRTTDIVLPSEAVPLVVANRTGRALRVFEGESLRGELPPDAELRLSVRPRTTIRVRAVSDDGREAWLRTFWIEPEADAGGPEARWELAPPRTTP